MRAGNEMSEGVGLGWRWGGGERPPTVIIITISKWAKPPAGSQRERLYFYLRLEEAGGSERCENEENDRFVTSHLSHFD